MSKHVRPGAGKRLSSKPQPTNHLNNVFPFTPGPNRKLRTRPTAPKPTWKPSIFWGPNKERIECDRRALVPAGALSVVKTPYATLCGTVGKWEGEGGGVAVRSAFTGKTLLFDREDVRIIGTVRRITSGGKGGDK